MRGKIFVKTIKIKPFYSPNFFQIAQTKQFVTRITSPMSKGFPLLDNKLRLNFNSKILTYGDSGSKNRVHWVWTRLNLSCIKRTRKCILAIKRPVVVVVA